MSDDVDFKAACQRAQMLPHLKDACMNCRMCELGWRQATRDNYQHDPHVFSNYQPLVGPARFMIVGQNPGWNEVKKGQPFVGAAGDNFDKAVNKTIWNRDSFYITNAVKCYTDNNATPSTKQMERCEPFLRMEIAIIKPIMVIAFGAIAFGVLCSGQDFAGNIGKITESEKFGVKVFATFHPSPLNLADSSRRARFYKDMATIGRIMDHYLTPF